MTDDQVHNCSNEAGYTEWFTAKGLEKGPIVHCNDGKWQLYVAYDQGCWININYCPYCGAELK